MIKMCVFIWKKIYYVENEFLGLYIYLYLPISFWLHCVIDKYIAILHAVY